MKIVEGYLPYLGYKTYYRIVGEKSEQQKPLILLHGGPGSTHNYFELFDTLAEDGRQLIMYDQLGCGLSPAEGRPDLWQAKTWVNELIALRQHLEIEECHILGQSWGGMLLIEYLCDHQPQGIQSVILSSTLPSAELWAQEQHRLIALMSESDQTAIKEAENSGNFNSPAYLTANETFMKRHSADQPNKNSAEPLRRTKVVGKEAYLTAWGPNEFTPNGTLKDWDYCDKLHTIKTPTLITSGTDDLSTPLIGKTMNETIPNSQWELFAKSRHMPFVDEQDRYLDILTNWLKNHD